MLFNENVRLVDLTGPVIEDEVLVRLLVAASELHEDLGLVFRVLCSPCGMAPRGE